MRRRACAACRARYRAALQGLRRWSPWEVLAAADTPAYVQAWAALDAATVAVRRCAAGGHSTVGR